VPDGPRLLSYASVAALLDCSTDTVRRLVKDGLLPEPKWYPHLGLRFRAEDVYGYVYGRGGPKPVKSKNDAAGSRRKPQIDPGEGGAGK
jgi:hypothetical protein